MPNCNFCGAEIKPGTGKMYVKKDGNVLWFCTRKCEKNMIGLRRIPRVTKWSKYYEK